MSSRISGVQADVLSLFRQLIRAAKRKGGENNKDFVKHVVVTFREQAGSVKRNDFTLIEYKLRLGHKQKKLIDTPGFKFAGFVGPNNN